MKGETTGGMDRGKKGGRERKGGGRTYGMQDEWRNGFGRRVAPSA